MRISQNLFENPHDGGSFSSSSSETRELRERGRLPKPTTQPGYQNLAWLAVKGIVLCALVGECLAQDSYVVLDRESHQGLYRIDPGGVITSLTPTVPWEYAHSVVRDRAGNFIVTVDVSDPYGSQDGVYRVTPDGVITPVVVGSPFSSLGGIAIDAQGDYIVANQTSDGHLTYGQILRVSPAGQLTVLHSGPPLRQPMGVAIDAQGQYVIADATTGGLNLVGQWQFLNGNGAVYRFNPATSQMTTVHSSVDANGYIKYDDLMGYLGGVAIDGDGDYVVAVATPAGYMPTGPTSPSTILKLRPDGTILQNLAITNFNGVVALDVAVDRQGNYIVADWSGRLLRLTPGGQVTCLLQTPEVGGPGGVVILPASEPPPPPPEIVGLSLLPGADLPRIRFAWKSEVGRQYRVQRASAPSGPWQDMAFAISGTGDSIEFSDQCAGTECGFYRIRLLNAANQFKSASNRVELPRSDSNPGFQFSTPTPQDL